MIARIFRLCLADSDNMSIKHRWEFTKDTYSHLCAMIGTKTEDILPLEDDHDHDPNYYDSMGAMKHILHWIRRDPGIRIIKVTRAFPNTITVYTGVIQPSLPIKK